MALGRNFHKSCGKDGGKVGENSAALRAAVFSLSSKNLRGGEAFKLPPAGRGLSNFGLPNFFSKLSYVPKFYENRFSTSHWSVASGHVDCLFLNIAYLLLYKVSRFNTRTGGEGQKCPPLRFFADSGKTAARSDAIFSVPAEN